MNILDYNDFKRALGNLSEIRRSKLEPRAAANRKIRDQNLDREMMIKDGKILGDDIVIPIRMVHDTILRNIARYENYLRAPSRIILLKDPHNPIQSAEQLDIRYSNGIKQPEWDTPFIRVADSGELHGAGFLEIVHDLNTDLQVNFEFIRFEDFCYDQKCKKLQRQPMIARRMQWNSDQLIAGIKSGFSEEVVGKLIGQNKDAFKLFDIYKVWTKVAGVVWVTWASEDCAEYLKELRKLDVIGEPETSYPVFDFRFLLTEDEELFQAKGRGFLDKDSQEAATQTWTSMINGTRRAARFYPSPKNIIDSNSETQILLKEAVMNKVPFDLLQMQYPPSSMLATVTTLQRQQAESSGSINFAAVTNKGSEKTATEIEAAQELETQISGTVMANYSRFYRNVHNFSWRWVQGLARRNQIDFIGTPVVVPELGVIYQNDQELLRPDYVVYVAGDYELVRAKELEQLFANFGDLFKGTPLGRVMTRDLLIAKFPEAGKRYADLYTQFNVLQDQTIQIAQGMLERIQGAEKNPATAEVVSQLFPDMPQLQNAIAQLSQLYSNSGAGTGPVETTPSDSTTGGGTQEAAGIPVM